MKFFKNLNNSFKAGIITLILTFIALIATIYLFFIDLKEVPLGILLGGIIFGGISLLGGLAENYDEKNQSTKFSIIIIIAKFFFTVLTLIGAALLYYLADIHLFNIFAIVGAYTVNVIVTIVVYLIYKK